MRIKVDIRGINETMDGLIKIEKGTKKAIAKGMNKWGKRLQGNMKLAVRKHIWRRRLYNSIEWRQRTTGLTVVLFMAKHGIYLDRAKAHWISLKKGRNITIWAQEKMGLPMTNRGKYPLFPVKAIKVKPHPFIERIYNPHADKLPQYIINEMRRENK